MAENEPAGIVALAAQTQQIVVQAQREIQFAAVHVIARLRIRNLKELQGGTQLFPQLSCAGIGLAGFGRPWPLTAFNTPPKTVQSSSSWSCRSRLSGSNSSWFSAI